LVREFRLPELIPDLLDAFSRCSANPIKTDPQCWAKNALTKVRREDIDFGFFQGRLAGK